MANPISFKPQPVDPHLELEQRLARAPRKHAEALLVVYDILEAAHENGTLDAVHGLVFARDKIAGRLAEYAGTPEGKAALLNLLELGKVLASLDPEVLAPLVDSMQKTTGEHRQEKTPPSTWQLFRRATSEDGRRGLSFLTLFLTNLGRSLKR
ncbi:DUF1641 domain-containing protein [Edaphobacter sp. 12200R-103]|uniref:DUF1641 domain-containing protein n=1 Tax=Edaphobacter sp. 12200R-103 TaxID=2703788 RepID=UPI00138DB7E2|nr:DUF1641 domain-containing protein [Edaphobacter sp. 12200R-103]QHS52021.1 DUF1641 domain-containing protein [Edaphobacter sp. 12200R-103]